MTDRTLEYYLSLPYRIEIYPEEDGSGYTAEIPDLPGCLTSAPTIAALGAMIAEAKQLWLEVALEDRGYIPEPAPAEAEEYSGRFVVRLPRSLHRQLAHRAELEGTSLNQLVVALLAEGMGRRALQLKPREEDAERALESVAPAAAQSQTGAATMATLREQAEAYLTAQIEEAGHERICVEIEKEGEEWHGVAVIPLTVVFKPLAGENGESEST